MKQPAVCCGREHTTCMASIAAEASPQLSFLYCICVLICAYHRQTSAGARGEQVTWHQPGELKALAQSEHYKCSTDIFPMFRWCKRISLVLSPQACSMKDGHEQAPTTGIQHKAITRRYTAIKQHKRHYGANSAYSSAERCHERQTEVRPTAWILLRDWLRRKRQLRKLW